MKKTISLFLFVFVLFFTNCTSNDKEDSFKSIKVGSYKFDVPSNFKLIELQGIDSYVGNIEGSGIIIEFDSGWFGDSSENVSPDQFEVFVDTVNGHYSQILKALQPQVNPTRIYLYKVQDSIDNPNNFISLGMSASGITTEEQEKVLAIYNSWTPVE